MAGKDKSTVVDMDPEVIHNYEASAERFDKLAKLAKQKQDALQKEYEGAVGKQMEASAAFTDANDALSKVNHEVDLQRRHVESLERQREELGRKIDAAQSSGDREKATELDNEFGQMRGEIDKAKQQLSETQSQQKITEADAEFKNNERVELDSRAQEIREQVDQVDIARTEFEKAAKSYTEADRNRDLADVAAGGDADATRKAVLGEADRVADQYHKTATEQAEVFEQLRQAEANSDSLKGQLNISKREQSRLEDQVKAAERAGRTDEAASLQKELQWRTDRTNQLGDRMLLDGGNIETLRAKNEELNEQAQALKADSEGLRKLSNEPPEKIEDAFTKRESDAAADARTATPIKGDANDTLATELEEEAAKAEAEVDPTTDSTTTDPTTTDPTTTDPTTTDPTTTDPTIDSDPGASLDDIDTGGPASADGDAPAVADAPAGDASDPGASLDDIDTGASAPAAAASAPDSEPTAEAAPRIVDDEMLEAPAAATVAQEPAVAESIQDAGTQEPEIEVERPAFDEPAVEPVAQEEPPAVEPEPEPEPEPEREFAE